MQRLLLSIFAGVGLACTVTVNDDDSSGTQPPATDTSAGPGPGGTSEAGGSTDQEDPTSAGATSAGATSAGPTSGPTSAETGNESSGEPGTAETGQVADVSFTDVFEQVILPNGCNAGYCHGGGAGGLDMTDEATTYANLVEVAATSPVCDQTVRVVPGSLDTSILWYRVRPAALDAGMPCAPKMPQGSMGLSDEQGQLVSDWIAGGALE